MVSHTIVKSHDSARSISSICCFVFLVLNFVSETKVVKQKNVVPVVVDGDELRRGVEA